MKEVWQGLMLVFIVFSTVAALRGSTDIATHFVALAILFQLWASDA